MHKVVKNSRRFWMGVFLAMAILASARAGAVSGCVSHAYKRCDGGNLFWFDSCGVRQGVYQYCGSNSITYNYRCDGSWLQREMVIRGCSNDACTQSPTWNNVQDCSRDGQVCMNNGCFSKASPPPALSGLEPSGAVRDARVSLKVTTDIPADCRYHWLNVGFDAMTQTFATSDGLRHSATATLANPGKYTYFIACRAAGGRGGPGSGKIVFTFAPDKPASTTTPATTPATPATTPAKTPPKSSDTAGAPKSETVAAVDKTPAPPLAPPAPPPPDRTAPKISNPAPSGDVDNALVKLSCYTDEAAACKYDVSDKPFDEMSGNMDDSIDGIRHGKKVILDPAGSYSYFVRCRDALGNKNPRSTKISFNYVILPGDPRIAGLGPAGAVYQRRVALTAQTDRRCECRYSLADADFDSLPNIFFTGDGVEHQAVVILPDYGRYVYYVRCEDKQGVADQTAAVIDFEYSDVNARKEPADGARSCVKIIPGTANSVCNSASDCVCDPDCPRTPDSDADPDCGGIAAGEKKGFGLAAAAAAFLGFIITAAIVLVLSRKKKDKDESLPNQGSISIASID